MYDFLLVLSSLIISIDIADKMMNALRSVKNIFGFFRGAAENLCYQIYWRMKIAVIMLMSIRCAEQTRKRKKELALLAAKTHCGFNQLSEFSGAIVRT